MCGLSGQLERLVLLICCWATGSHAVSADRTVFFADPNFKAAVEEKLGISDPNATDMLALTELDACGNRIIYLTGIEYAANLTKLSLTGNWISDISPVSGLTKLTRLRLGENRISDISPLSGLKNLTELDLNNNQLRDVSVISGLKKLTNLSLFNNEISDIQALSNLTNLKELYLHYNQIRDISAISGLTNLTKLFLNNNQITDISTISGLINLTELFLRSNQIADLSAVSSLTNLIELSAANNKIVSISTVAELKNLNRLSLSHNQITDVSPLYKLENLKWLELNYNRHNDISFGSGLTNLSLIEALNKNMELLSDPNIDNVKKRAQGNLGGLIAQNITEHLVYIINECGGFEELKNILNRKLQDYPENPKGKYYSNNGLGAYFIIYDNVIAYFFSVYDIADDSTQYTNIGFLRLMSQDAFLPDRKGVAAPGYFHAPFYSPPNIDVFDAEGSIYILEWSKIPGSGGFSQFTLSTIKDGEITTLEEHDIIGIIELYDFDNRVLYTVEHREKIKEGRIYGSRAIYEVAYLIDDKIETYIEECANPWYLVLKDYLEAIWEEDIVKAKQFVLDEKLVERTKHYKYADSHIPLGSVEDLNLEGENIEKEVKTLYLYYEYKGGTNRTHDCIAFDFKECNGEWKIIDIRDPKWLKDQN